MHAEGAERKEGPSRKRKEKYHELFKSIPKNEALEYSTSCILSESSKFYQGRIYIGTEHICFFSKSFFGKASIIINLKTVMAIETTTKIILHQCLNVVTYDKTFSFRAVSLKDTAYYIAVRLWQKTLGLTSRTSSIFQADVPRPIQHAEESAFVEEERIFAAPMRELIKEIANQEKAEAFYQTLTDDSIIIKTYLNRRTIQFSNEFIDEIYQTGKNTVLIDYHSRGTLCKIQIIPHSTTETRVVISEKYNYTTQHYFSYVEQLIQSKGSRLVYGCVDIAWAATLLLKVLIGIPGGIGKIKQIKACLVKK
ncbi:hypothetical protein NEDG_01967 [Nematocida displodere]|uniref:GRAM domain-containing protein n=1 Tax=Nematocida displodere TaxID=1805483 RepID=A0A177EJ66_9MICR|nr:hypothetical protein NEDG_01967 [Nematocida displodere]